MINLNNEYIEAFKNVVPDILGVLILTVLINVVAFGITTDKNKINWEISQLEVGKTRLTVGFIKKLIMRVVIKTLMELSHQVLISINKCFV